MENREPSSTGLDANVAAGLSYLTIIAGIIFFMIEKQSRFVRVNAMQEILLSVVSFVVWIVLIIVQVVASAINDTLSLGIGCVQTIFWIAFFIVWLIAIIKAFTGSLFRIPVITNMAEKYA